MDNYLYNNDSDEFITRADKMSNTVIDIMIRIKDNDALAMLVKNNLYNPFSIPVTQLDKDNLIKVDSDDSKISPRPFSPETQVVDSSFIRVYYNIGEFEERELYMDAELHIDIVVAKNLWLINDNNENSLIRPYEIMSRIVDVVGKSSANPIVQFTGFQHLAVNNNFDAIRLYAKNYNA